MNLFLEILYGFFLPPAYLIHLPFRKLSIKDKLIRGLLVLLSPSTWILVFSIIYFSDSLTDPEQVQIAQESEYNSREADFTEVAGYEDESSDAVYSTETISWPGGPTPLTEAIRKDFYQTLFFNRVSYLYGDEYYEKPDKDTIHLAGHTFNSYIEGAGGIAWSMGMKGAVDYFQDKRGAGKFPDKESYLSYAENFIGIPLFNEEMQENLNVEFRCYNPEVVRWLFDNMIPDPELVIDGHKFQEIYDVIGSRYFRLMVESYLYLQRIGVDKETHRYKMAMKNRGFDGMEYFEANYGHILPDFTYPDYAFSYFTPGLAVGYWLRRSIDGSAADLYNGYLKVVKLYDPAWYEDVPEKYRDKIADFEGDYVSKYYEKRDEPVDWRVITVKNNGDGTARIIVRSRATFKTPACSFEGDVFQENDSTLAYRIMDDKRILFIKQGNELHLKTSNEKDWYELLSLCGGGTGLTERHVRLNKKLDDSQLIRFTLREDELGGYKIRKRMLFDEIDAKNNLTAYSVTKHDEPVIHLQIKNKYHVLSKLEFSSDHTLSRIVIDQERVVDQYGVHPEHTLEQVLKLRTGLKVSVDDGNIFLYKNGSHISYEMCCAKGKGLENKNYTIDQLKKMNLKVKSIIWR